jgi:vacuolar protein sorting-associated protein IST1
MLWSKSKVNIRLALSRIRLQSTKKQAQLKPQARDIAKLLDEGKEVTARAQTEQLIRDEKLIEAHSQLEIFCEQFLARFDAISREKYMPKDLVICLCSLVYAAPRVDVEELKKVASNLELKYGTLWADSCHSNLHGQVHQQIFSNLSIGRAPASLVDEHMVKIAKEFEIDWSPLLPSANEQDLQATFQAAQSLHGSSSAPISKSLAAASTPQTVVKVAPTPSTSFSVAPSGPSSSPPLNAAASVELRHIIGSATGSTVDEELLMIDMLPNVPSNMAVSMDLAPLGMEGGVIVTHEEDEDDFQDLGKADMSTGELMSDFVEMEDLYDNILACEDIPDGPYFEVAPSHNEHTQNAHPTRHVEPVITEDPLLARLNRLKSR